MKILNINSTGFLMVLKKKNYSTSHDIKPRSTCVEEVDRGTFSESYFSPHIIPTVPHTPWEYQNIPIPPGIKDKVLNYSSIKCLQEYMR